MFTGVLVWIIYPKCSLWTSLIQVKSWGRNIKGSNWELRFKPVLRPDLFLIICLMKIAAIIYSLTYWGLDKMATILQTFFFHENYGILIQVSLEYVRKGPTNIDPALVQIMAWCQSGANHYLNQWWYGFLMYICITWPQWVNNCISSDHRNQLKWCANEHRNQLKWCANEQGLH